LGAQLFWNVGRGFNEADSNRQNYEKHPNLQTLRFPLPSVALKGLRFDPLDHEMKVAIRSLRITDKAERTLVKFSLTDLTPLQDISKCEIKDSLLLVETNPGGKDPILIFSP